jgi:hypothetical protein
MGLALDDYSTERSKIVSTKSLWRKNYVMGHGHGHAMAGRRRSRRRRGER